MLGDLPWFKLLPYSLAQLLGAYLGSGLVYLIYYGKKIQNVLKIISNILLKLSLLFCIPTDAIMEFSGGVLTVFGPNETASIFATYPTDVVSVQTNFLDQVR